MAVKNCGSEVPRPAGGGGEGEEKEGGEFDVEQAALTAEDEELLKSARECLGVVRPLIGETQQLHKSLEVILQVSRKLIVADIGASRQNYIQVTRTTWEF